LVSFVVLSQHYPAQREGCDITGCHDWRAVPSMRGFCRVPWPRFHNRGYFSLSPMGGEKDPSCGECRERFSNPILSPPSGHAALHYNNRAGSSPMPIPDDRLPDFDEADEDANSSALPEMLDEEDELEFESADADEVSDEILEPDEAEDTATFGYGDPVE
jgi:hypothetical protein